jgi:hypothetical protein
VLTLLILTFDIVRFVVEIIFGFFFNDEDVDEDDDGEDDSVLVLLIKIIMVLWRCRNDKC